MHNAIYSGWVTHNRVLPRIHKFTYPISMFFLAYNELEELSHSHKLISIDQFNVLSFKHKDYLTKADILAKLAEQGYTYSSDNICILTHLSYLGFCYNPVSFYYCYNQAGDRVEYMLAEINNTPWNERFVYCFKCDEARKTSKFIVPKQFHISPFMPMNIMYHWYFYNSDKKIIMVLRSFMGNKMQFAATMQLRKTDINKKSILKYTLSNVLVTQMILLRIYWQAFKLWCKRIPFYSHPRSIDDGSN